MAGSMADGAKIEVRLRPRGSKNELLGMRDGVAPSRVGVVRGEKSREKVVRVTGIARAELDAALEGL